MPAPINFLLESTKEEVAEEIDVSPIIADIKKQMGLCKADNFKNEAAGKVVFNALFTCQLKDDDTELKFYDWVKIYEELLADAKFNTNLCMLMAIYVPERTDTIFRRLYMLAKESIIPEGEKEASINAISKVKVAFCRLYTDYGSFYETIRAQIVQSEALEFITVTTQTLSAYIDEFSKMIHDEVENKVEEDDVEEDIKAEDQEPSEEIKAIEECFNNILTEFTVMNEAVLRNSVMKAKVQKKKFSGQWGAFETKANKLVQNWREKRKQRKHEEMVGDALYITRMLKRLLTAGAAAVVAGPVVALLGIVGAIAVDKATAINDRREILNQLSDELEIVEEKIALAERNGDDKAKIELIRLRQKLTHETERINRLKLPTDARRR